MSQLAIEKNLSIGIDQAIEKVTSAIKEIGFGILTRIDFDQKIKEKLDKKIARVVILGACNPKLAYEAYQQSTDVALLIPCNITIRDNENGTCTVEAMRPSQMLKMLPGLSGIEMVMSAEKDLERVLQGL